MGQPVSYEEYLELIKVEAEKQYRKALMENGFSEVVELSEAKEDRPLVKLHEAFKINDRKLDALEFHLYDKSCMEKDKVSHKAQLIYIAEGYEGLKDLDEEDPINREIEILGGKLVGVAMHHLPEAMKFTSEVQGFTSTFDEEVKERIYPMLLNPDLNETFLREKPFREWNDLVITYYINDTYYNVQIYDSLMKHWGLTEEELYNISMENLNKRFERNLNMEGEDSSPDDIFIGDLTKACGMMATSLAFTGEPAGFEAMNLINILRNPSDKMIFPGVVVTTYRKQWGASLCLCEKLMEFVADRWDDDIYFTINSFHESVMFSATAIEENERRKAEDGIQPLTLLNLRDTSDEMYLTQTGDDEKLSGCVYHYNRVTKETKLV